MNRTFSHIGIPCHMSRFEIVKHPPGQWRLAVGGCEDGGALPAASAGGECAGSAAHAGSADEEKS